MKKILSKQLDQPTSFFEGKALFSESSITSLSRLPGLKALFDKEALLAIGQKPFQIDIVNDKVLTVSVHHFLLQDGSGIDKEYHLAHHIISSGRIISAILGDHNYFDLAKSINRQSNGIHEEYILSGEKGGNMFLKEVSMQVFDKKIKGKLIYVFSHMNKINNHSLTE